MTWGDYFTIGNKLYTKHAVVKDCVPVGSDKQLVLDITQRMPHAVNMLIPDWLVNPMPDDMIALRQLGVVLDINNPERYMQRCNEIIYEVSEEMAVLP